MKIIKKISKGKGNTYIIHFEEEKITVYDDLVIKYEILLKKQMDNKELEELKKEQASLESYYIALKYLNARMRSKKEIREYLKKKEYSKKDIDNALEKLSVQGYINDENYAKSYIHDEISLSLDGPLKIAKKLEQLGISKDIYNDMIWCIEQNIWDLKINKLIEKKEKTYRKESNQIKKMKIMNYIIKEGYPKEWIQDKINNIENEDETERIQKEIKKLEKKLALKYNGKDLQQMIEKKLYLKGFTKDTIGRVLK